MPNNFCFSGSKSLRRILWKEVWLLLERRSENQIELCVWTSYSSINDFKLIILIINFIIFIPIYINTIVSHYY